MAIASARSSPAPRLRLTVTLRHVEPRVRRELDVDASITFAELHDAIQRAMGWQDCHLHEFKVGRMRIGVPDPNDDFGPPPIDQRARRLSETLDGVRRFEYWYDFGDDWWHDIAVRRSDAPAHPAARVVLVAGEGACPPEDCGGPPGYEALLVVLADPRHPEHADMRAWAGDFDPSTFDLDAAQRRSASRFAPRKKR